MSDGTVAILWGASHLWGLMAHRAMAALGAPHYFIMAQEIAQGGLFRKRPAVLLVPGGSARQKAQALGQAGLNAIREWISAGGFYLGFCGGAGLALTAGEADGLGREAGRMQGLGLCPWRRMVFSDRIYHLISGHVLAETADGYMELPVWWPGRFEEAGGDVEVLARYAGPGKDLWLADLPLASVPENILRYWHDLGRMDASRAVGAGQPLAVRGRFGQGEYVLSYAHLETPDSPGANAWLAQLLREKANLQFTGDYIPPWRIPGAATPESLAEDGPLAIWQHIMALGRKLGFFFSRTPWLQGWRRGAPGMGCNHLLACLDALGQMTPGSWQHAAQWETEQRELAALFAAFDQEAEICFWNMRLSGTLDEKGNEAPAEAWNRLFGHPMLGGGQIDRLLALLEKLVYRRQARLRWDFDRDN